MKSIDIKSLRIGILGTLLVIACAGATTSVKINSGVAGLYQATCSSKPHTCIVINTSTGQIVGSINNANVKTNAYLIKSNVRD